MWFFISTFAITTKLSVRSFWLNKYRESIKLFPVLVLVAPSDFVEYRQTTGRVCAIPATGCQTKAEVEMLLGRRFSASAGIIDKLDTPRAYFPPYGNDPHSVIWETCSGRHKCFTFSRNPSCWRFSGHAEQTGCTLRLCGSLFNGDFPLIHWRRHFTSSVAIRPAL